MPTGLLTGWLLVLAGGLGWALCFGSMPRTLLAAVTLTPLLLLSERRRAATWGFLFGLLGWLGSISWIGPTLEIYGELPAALAVFLLLALCSILAAYVALFAWVAHRVWRLGAAAALWLLPAAWVTLEWLRAHALSGFPWNLAGYAWVEMPGALATSAWIGAYGVSYLLLLVNTGLAIGLTRRRWDLLLLACLSAVGVLGLGARYAGPPDPAGATAPVRLVQPAIANLTAWDPVRIGQNYSRLLRMTAEACDLPGALIVWPESAGWPYVLERDREFRRDVERLSSRCPLLLNSPRREGEKIFNAALLIDRGEVVASHDKRHLVPFGEYVPLARLLPFIGTVARNAGSFSPGEAITLLPWRELRLGTAVCYEVIFPQEIGQLVRAGASLLVSVTNDAWYGDTFAPWQHWRAARFRAAENHRTVVRAAITGVSGIISPDGGVRASLGVNETGILRAEVGGAAHLTLCTRYPWATPALCSLILGAVVIFRRWRGSSR